MSALIVWAVILLGIAAAYWLGDALAEVATVTGIVAVVLMLI